MGENTRNHHYTVELENPLSRRYIGLLLASDDSNGDEFFFTLKRDGENIAQSGNAIYTATFIRADGATVMLEGVNQNGVVRVTLDKWCYKCEGRFVLTVKSTIAEDVTTLAIIDGHIRQTATGDIVDPDERIVSVPELMEIVGELEQTTEEAKQAVAGIGNSLDRVDDAVNSANNAIAELEQAKASGEFNGEPGKDGTSVTVKSISESSADGGSNVVTFSDGKKLTVKNGSKGSPGNNGYTPVKGVDYTDGEDGHTPVKGVDYYTDADKAEFTQYIASEMAKRGQLMPEFANDIDGCTDTSKLYVLPDGYIYAYMAYNTEGGKVPNFTNLMDDPGAYIKEGYRYSSSSAAFKVQASDCAVVIPINAAPSADMTIRMRGAQAGASYASSSYFGPTNQAFPNAQGGNAPVFTTESNGDLTITVKNAAASGTKYGVFHVKAGVDADNLIVTLNEPITYTTTEGGTEYRWASTGRAFVPADYEDRIVDVENNVNAHSNQINALVKKVENINADESKDAAYARIKGWNAPVYDDAPVFLLDTPKDALNANTIAAQPVAGVYAAYDALMAQNTHYITREDCGLASDGTTHIYAYHFKTPVTRDNQGNTKAEQKPVILACSGVHPLEQAGVYSLYNAMEEITTNPKLGDLRRNVHFVVVPMLNPTGVSDTEYHMRNPDGIQVHYNFEVEHGSNGAVQGDQNYGGATPLSIPEAQYFDALMAEYQDNLACVLSCHNFGQDNARGAGYIWWSCGTTFMVNLGIRFCEKMSDAWHEKYGDAFTQGVHWANDYAVANWGGTAQPDWDLRVGWANLSSSGGSEYRQAIKYGVHGVNVEVCPLCMVLDKNATAYYSSNAMTWGCETYINFFLTYMAWYDLMRKQDYAPNLPWEG